MYVDIIACNGTGQSSSSLSLQLKQCSVTLVPQRIIPSDACSIPYPHVCRDMSAEVESPASSASRNATADFAPTPPPVALSSHHASSDTPLAAPALETPIGARNLPTPFGTMGRAALPPTPYAPGSVTPSVAAAQLSSWRSRAANAAFKAKSPPTSRSALLKPALHLIHPDTVYAQLGYALRQSLALLVSSAV